MRDWWGEGSQQGEEAILDNAAGSFYDLPRPGRVLRRRALLVFLVLGRSIPRSAVPLTFESLRCGR